MGTFKEKRKHPRFKVSLPIKFRKIYGQTYLEGKTSSEDFSQKGIRFKSDGLLNPNSRLLLEIKLPSESTVIRGISRIVWVKKLSEKNDYEFGNEFISLTEDSERLIYNFLQKLSPEV